MDQKTKYYGRINKRKNRERPSTPLNPRQTVKRMVYEAETSSTLKEDQAKTNTDICECTDRDADTKDSR